MLRPARLLSVVSAVFVTACSDASPPPAPAQGVHTGVYSALTYGKADPGDIGGIELEIVDRGPDSRVVFTRCEGGCWGGYAWPAVIEGDRLAFTPSEVSEATENGKPAARWRYVGRFEGDRLLIESPDDPTVRRTLRRLKDPEPGRTVDLAVRGR